MFVDEITIKIEAGKGGDGCTSFRREKYIEMGGPDGANGGRGSNIIFKVDEGLKTLVDLRYMRQIKGTKGANGKGSNRTGSNAEDIIISIPQGTTITDVDTGLVIADVVAKDAEVIVARGGRGGRGNKSFATQSDPAPRMSEYGEPGEFKIIRCELKVLADVGLVGMPSVGKSSILAIISSANPKIGAYHFTTLNPNLGVIKLNDRRNYVIADLPGLIEGAANGAGLGQKFLRHAMRTKIIAHVIDMGAFEGRNPIVDYETIRLEIEKYNTKLANKIEIIIANKMDLPNAKDNLTKFKAKFPNLEIIEVSALDNMGLEEMLIKFANLLDDIKETPLYSEEEYESHVLYKFNQEKPYTITKENDLWVIQGAEIEKLFKMTKFSEDEAVLRFSRKLRGMGIEDELEKLGAKRGEDVSILDYVFTFKD